MSYDKIQDLNHSGLTLSQSLWNRAVSYDAKDANGHEIDNVVSIPLEQGSVLRRRTLDGLVWDYFVSIPLEQGSVLRPYRSDQMYEILKVSIPLEQGSVLRQIRSDWQYRVTRSQSLWNRAVSYDRSGVIKPCATRLTEATSQLFPRLRELGLNLIKC